MHSDDHKAYRGPNSEMKILLVTVCLCLVMLAWCEASTRHVVLKRSSNEGKYPWVLGINKSCGTEEKQQ